LRPRRRSAWTSLRPARAAGSWLLLAEEAFDATTQIDGDQEQRWTEEQPGIFSDARQRLLEQQVCDSADHRAEWRAKSAQDHHDHEIAGAGPEHDGWADEICLVGKERPGK